MISALPAPETIAAILATFLVAGTVKGAFGIGFPAVAMAIFPFFIEPALGVTLLALPIVITNAQQFLSVRGWPRIVRRFLVAGGSLAVTIFLVSQFLDDVSSRWINAFVGFSLVVFALSAMSKIRLPVTEGSAWQLLVGVSSGLFGGVSAVKVPVMIYTVALDLPRDAFIAAAGFLFFCGGAGMLTGLTSAALVNHVTLPLSVAAVAFSLAGFWVGSRIRKRLKPEQFRKYLLWVMLLLGARLLVVNLLPPL